MQRKLLTAFGAYAVIAILAGLTLDGKLRLAVWIFSEAWRSRPISRIRLTGRSDPLARAL